jgi:hypothetical protein
LKQVIEHHNYLDFKEAEIEKEMKKAKNGRGS